MNFTIAQNSNLPILKLQVVKDGIEDYNSMMEFIERSSIFFSMVDTLTGIPKIYSKTARFVEKLGLDPNASPEYYIYYKFTTQDTNRVGRYEGQFVFINDTNSGNILTITAKDNTSTATVSWMVIGQRKDPHIISTDWTDDQGNVIVEPIKEVTPTP